MKTGVESDYSPIVVLKMQKMDCLKVSMALPIQNSQDSVSWALQSKFQLTLYPSFQISLFFT